MCRDWKQVKCNHHFPELNKKKKIIKSILKFFTPNKINAIAIILVLIIGLTYLVQTNVTAVNGYKIKSLKDKLSQLQVENKKLNLTYIELQSMANVIGQVPDLNLVAAENIEIITPIGSTVALR
ncbi:MAG: hypothetical protein A3B89_00790 [Candidatus Buchananbacteria bacterium RIFCSPHIGHO2_02_FULL_40_13]|uniref:Cell division protein FtsL n=1 Tax=Candidatus Buchananbacteria bacterium RIFCSPLOWO2_01_FULL_39_33 TaxID=1797543 RepID=A0A1G1YIL4_9BACT|nr:MAG: hypothetical protein A2820_00855 [Candidatus Buchananbacteria bacterium RIFCSPHIGHO2_01_FULL_40_35]OGY50410.1 MAG: hypothetical protein A3B89_00790 [Candidatus Buchananbacteria bacterium RIFCSPHIGHO2_02_FULL_40_13]OGY51550.1 MAG: hypothetical protein A3A02_01945 [Candidatus Buchananbacteria bacterium RIFCSPLOWO2_01_FULL_39_33]